MNEAVLYSTLLHLLRQEDEELTRLSGFGIFYAPELYIALLMGKEIKRWEQEIFGKPMQWIRETNFGNGGPTDFAFRSGSETYAFELKLRSTVDDYSADVEKLKKLDSGYQKYFIALVDSWSKDRGMDGRITELEQKHRDLRKVAPFGSFPTVQNWYTGQIDCTLGIWTITQ